MVFCFSGVLITSFLEKSHQAVKQIDVNDLQAHVLFLSSDALGGRLTGSIGEKRAARYVARIFRDLGLEPAGDNGSYFQQFNFSPGIANLRQPQNKQHGINVLAKLRLQPGISEIIVVGAHADHLGHGELSGSLAHSNEKGLIHYGADDNASGVAGVIEAAVMLRDMQARGTLHGNKDILFAVWSGEEFGILGSGHFIKNFMQKTDNQPFRSTIVADINLDMIGRMRDHLILQGVGSSLMWPKLIQQANIMHPVSLVTQNDPYLPTDSTSFYLRGIPTINFFTGAHAEYHTPRDRPETLNYEGIKNIAEFLVAFILAIEHEPDALDYQEVRKTSNASGSGFKVYLGTIPDYASSDSSGVKLSGVTKGSPAERAGIKADDVIIELAGKKIQNIYDYSLALKGLQPGKSAKLIVLRGQERVTIRVVARSRT